MVQNQRDIDEFEFKTNKEFNANFETAPIENTYLKNVPWGAVRDRSSKEAFYATQFSVDNNAYKNFSFKKRYKNNIKHGRNTSAIQSELGFFPKLDPKNRKSIESSLE